jgi:hypothetical protein
MMELSIQKRKPRMRYVCMTLAVVSLSALLASAPVSAQGKKKGASKAVKCDVCEGKMSMTAKKTATNTQAVTINGKSYYCCPCDMSKSKIAGLKVTPPK